MCDSGYSHASHVMVWRFGSVAAALEFAERRPCDSPHCAGLHILTWRRGSGELGGVRIFGQPAPPPLAEELNQLYPRSGPEPVAWAAPSVLNRPLPPPRGVH